jgi:serine/threonine protein kinase
MKEVLVSLHMLRRSLRYEKAQEKVGERSSWGTQAITQKVDDHGSGIPSSGSIPTVTSKFGILDIFSRKARRFESYGGSILKALNVTVFTSKELRKITNNYSTVIGHGFTGSVYMGLIEGHVVAVKWSVHRDQTFDKDNFVRAMVSGSAIRHMNIIRLLGCCLETEPPLLVYEDASSGGLHDLLHCYNGRCSLTLDLRLDIAIGSAQALEYLHSTQILFGDVSSSKIVLDHDFLPKVSDIFPGLLMSNSGCEFRPCCDMSYVDPVYVKTGHFTSKSDVYSFGVVLLELITRKQPINVDENFCLQLAYVKAFKDENSGKAMFDEEIAVEGNMLILEEMGKLAVECQREDTDKRPEMVEVVERLQIRS